MDAHQQPGALDALIQDGLAMQALAPDLEQLVHEGVHDVLGVHFNDAPLPSLGQPHLPAVNAHTNGDGGGADLVSQMLETNGSGAPARPRRRAAAAAANFATDIEGSEEDDSQDADEEGDAATGSSGRPDGRGSKRRRAAGAASDAPMEKKSQHMKGRFSGRLPTKDDERKLAEECQAMAPRLSKDGDLTTLPTIIRAMARGSVRAHLESEHAIKENAIAKLAMLQAHAGGNGADVMNLTEENMALRDELSRAQNHIAALERERGQHHDDMRLQGMGSCVPPAAATQLPPAPVTVSLTHAPPPMQLTSNAAVQPPQQVVISTAPTHAGGIPTTQVVQVPAGTTLQPGQVVQVQHAPETQTAIVMQELLPSTQPVVVTAVQPTAVASAGMLRVASSAHLVTAASQQVQQVQPTLTVVSSEMAQQPGSASGDGDPAAAAAGEAATNLNEHAQQLTVTAHLHGAAKTEAAVQAQQLAAQAQQHAHASVQAAQQAEELKKTLSVLPDSQHTQQAAYTVQNLEARAQAHASITTQVVAQARGMHEKAQAHEKEQLKAITQATVLQAHAQSLQASAVQLEAHVTSNGGPTGSGPAVSAEQHGPPVSAPLSGMHGNGQQQPGNSAGMPTGSNGGPLTSADVGPPGGIDANMHATTPHSSASGGNVFATIAATQPAPVAVVSAQQMTIPQQMQLVVQQQPAVVQQPGVVQLSAVQADAAALMQQASASAAQQQAAQTHLYQQQSGEHMAMAAENAALHQQVVALQAQQAQQAANQAAQNAQHAAQHGVQHVQMVATSVPPQTTRAPVTVQLIAAPSMHHSSSHGLLMHAASGSVHLDNTNAQQVAPPQPQQVIESAPQQQESLVAQEPTPSQIAADMGPVVSIPAPTTQPVVSGQ